MRDSERMQHIRSALSEARLDALICALPRNVLLLSGYWPVVGTSVAIATGDHVLVIAPEDEQELARAGWADEVRTFKPASLKELRDTDDALRAPLRAAAHDLRILRARLGYEYGPHPEPSSYAAMHLYGGALTDLLDLAELVPADELLMRLAAVKTRAEQERIRTACLIAAEAFAEGARQLRPGLKETEAAALFRVPLSTHGVGRNSMERADGFTFCMSGVNSAEAYGAYARSRARRIAPGDLVLVHCNSYADGYWTDITRTYAMCHADERKRRMYEAVLQARRAALAVLGPGVLAREVDRAARDVLNAYGFEQEFKHPTGHGVGFSAISPHARPRIHPQSPDVLQPGMVFNIEPAIYIEDFGGLRHCDMVAITENGAELLTPFQSRLEDLLIPATELAA